MKRWLALTLVLAALAWGQEEPPPQTPSTLSPEERKAQVIRLLRDPEPIWAYFPVLTDPELAEELRARVYQEKTTLILFPLKESKRPNSYSLMFFLLQTRFPRTLFVRWLPLENTGEAAILIRKSGEVWLDGEKASDEMRTKVLTWWRKAWPRAVQGDPVAFAREVFLGRTPKIGP